MTTFRDLALLGNTLIAYYLCSVHTDRSVALNTILNIKNTRIQFLVQYDMLTIHFNDETIVRRPIKGTNGEVWKQASEAINERIEKSILPDFEYGPRS